MRAWKTNPSMEKLEVAIYEHNIKNYKNELLQDHLIGLRKQII